MESKASLRAEMRARLELFSHEERMKASLQACALLQTSQIWQQSRTVMLYAAQSWELDTRFFIEAAWAASKGVCLPKMTNQPRKMEPRFLTTLQHLQPGRLGILEPDPTFCPVMELSQMDFILVPGLAFDRQGHRLGRGGGYYDALLQRPDRRGAAIGAFFSFQEVPSIPHEEHDALLDGVVTEKELFLSKLSF
ncbi:MAG: 5-formyltetrahydrofolate cyclo-ligase [bacterium]